MASVCTHKSSNILIVKAAGETDLSKWKLLHTITDFTMPVNFVQWSSDNKILATSFDNNCMVIEKDGNSGKWTPHLVVLDSQYRSLMAGCWAPDGKKFAVAGGNKAIYIGYWDDNLRSYNSKRLKRCIL